MSEFDFSEYTPNEIDIYRRDRSSKSEILLDYTCSKVAYDPKAKCIFLTVDDEVAFRFERVLVDEAVEGTLQESDAKEEEHDNQDVTDALAKLEKSFEIRYYEHGAGTGYNLARDNSKNHLYYADALSGARIRIPLGQGLLDFCYIDMKKNLDALQLIGFFMSDDVSKIMTGKDREAITVKTREQYHDIIYAQFEKSLIANPFYYSSLYTAAFPPCFLKAGSKSIKFYLHYIKILREEFLEKIEFCFDEDFYPEVLGTLNPVERYALYCEIKQIPTSYISTVEFDVVNDFRNGKMMNWLNGKNKVQPSAQLDEFCEKYGLNKEEGLNPKNKRTMKRTEVRSIFDMLNYEFSRMLESDIRIRKCKNCGKYFVLKGNYNTDYCDRLVEGSVRTCQAVGAEKVYKEKIATEEGWKLYKKYYKRYYARIKVGTIKEKDFNRWQYEAVGKRDDCLTGNLSAEEYEAWLEGSFKNREKKSK